MSFLSRDWCNLQWSDWVPLADREGLSHLPNLPGLYKVRPIGKDFLVYIGQTGRSVRDRMKKELAVYLKSDTEMPFNDPHTAAASLWAWRDATGWDFECSVAVQEFSGLSKEEGRKMREGTESFLLYQYRLEQGESTYCNFGRFHKNYTKSSNRKNDRRGGKLPEGKTNPAGGPSLPPLETIGSPTDNTWMGLKWSKAINLNLESLDYLQPLPGYYKVIVDNDVVYIGQSSSISKRVHQHCGKLWGTNPQISVVYADTSILPYQLHEIENDLIGGYFARNGRPPKFQFTNLTIPKLAS